MRGADRTFQSDCRVFLNALDEGRQAQVLMGARPISYPAGTLQYLPEIEDYADIVERGLVRVFVTATDGRQATVRYVHPGDLVGTAALLPLQPPRVYVQAITDCAVTKLDLSRLRSLCQEDATYAMAMAAEMGARYAHSIRIISVRSLGGIRERLAFDLLDRACEAQLRTGQLIAGASQQQLADSIGSVREVVSRILRDLRAEGVIATTTREVKVLDVMRLERIVAGAVP
jgi:CRP/FNR family transcriptional regulator